MSQVKARSQAPWNRCCLVAPEALCAQLLASPGIPRLPGHSWAQPQPRLPPLCSPREGTRQACCVLPSLRHPELGAMQCGLTVQCGPQAAVSCHPRQQGPWAGAQALPPSPNPRAPSGKATGNPWVTHDDTVPWASGGDQPGSQECLVPPSPPSQWQQCTCNRYRWKGAGLPAPLGIPRAEGQERAAVGVAGSRAQLEGWAWGLGS